MAKSKPNACGYCYGLGGLGGSPDGELVKERAR